MRMLRRTRDDDAKRSEARVDALELIKADHEEVRQLFEQALDDGATAAQRRGAIAKVCEALTLHSKMEETIFYPALRKAGGKEEKDAVLEAFEEHGIVKDLIRKIQRVEGRDETLKAKVTVLKESVEHHVREEESEIFDEARRALGADGLAELGAHMQRFKERARNQSSGSTRRPRTTAGRSRTTSSARRRRS